jgi:hypothetical protein
VNPNPSSPLGSFSVVGNIKFFSASPSAYRINVSPSAVFLAIISDAYALASAKFLLIFRSASEEITEICALIVCIIRNGYLYLILLICCLDFLSLDLLLNDGVLEPLVEYDFTQQEHDQFTLEVILES